MPWSELIGHEAPVAGLRRAVESGRLHPGLLFHGPDAVGKHLAARLLAQTLLCKSISRPGDPDPNRDAPLLLGSGGSDTAAGAREISSDPCGLCDACRRVAAGVHPDLRLVSFEISESTRKLRTEIVIDQIRDLSAFLALRPMEGARKIAIADPADRMNAAAANAFLKTLEEPPAGCVLILVAQNRHSLLPTILSRCLPVAFGRVPVDAIRALLAKRGAPDADAALAAALSDGAVGKAVALAGIGQAPAAGTGDGESEGAPGALDAWRERRNRILGALELAAGAAPKSPAGRGTRALRAAEAFAPKDNEEFPACLELAEALLRDVVRLLVAGGGRPSRELAPVAGADVEPRIGALARALGDDRAMRALTAASALRSELRAPINRPLAIECFLLRLAV